MAFTAKDATGAGQFAGSGVPTISSYAVPSGTDLMVVTCSWYPAFSGTSGIASVTWNGSENLAEIVEEIENDDSGVSIWFLRNPTATTANVTCTRDGASTQEIYIHVTCWAGEDGSTAPTSDSDQGVDASGDGIEIDAFTGPTDGLQIFVGSCWAENSWDAAGKQTLIVIDDQTGSGNDQVSEYAIGSGSKNYGWVASGIEASVGWAAAVAGFTPAAAGGGPPSIKPEKLALQPMTGVD